MTRAIAARYRERMLTLAILLCAAACHLLAIGFFVYAGEVPAWLAGFWDAWTATVASSFLTDLGTHTGFVVAALVVFALAGVAFREVRAADEWSDPETDPRQQPMEGSR